MIKDFKTGEHITAYLLLKEVELKASDQNVRLTLVLGDRTGEIDAVVWENPQEVKSALDGATVVKVKGVVGSYLNRPQVKVEKIRKAEASEFNLADLKRASSQSPEELSEQFATLLQTIKNPQLLALLHLFQEDQELFSKYLVRPAGKKFHHDFVSGLADHSISLAKLADLVCQRYAHLDRDLLVTGALLHDLGKIEEFEGEIVYDYSDIGRLVGHVTLGDHLVAQLIEKLPDFPKQLELKLRHLLLSHHGEREKGASVTPKTREAYVLHYLDEIDSKLDSIDKIEEKTEGAWSEYIKPLEDFLYFG